MESTKLVKLLNFISICNQKNDLDFVFSVLSFEYKKLNLRLF